MEPCHRHENKAEVASCRMREKVKESQMTPSFAILDSQIYETAQPRSAELPTQSMADRWNEPGQDQKNCQANTNIYHYTALRFGLLHSIILAIVMDIVK